MPKQGKTHHEDSISFDALSVLHFPNVASVGAAVANTTVQARLPLPVRCKVRRVVVNYSAIGSGGDHQVNVVRGTGTPAASAGEDAVAGANASVFTADQTLSAAADTPTLLTPTQPDAIYDAGHLLTLRAVTPASTGSFTNLHAAVLVCPVDARPMEVGAREL